MGNNPLNARIPKTKTELKLSKQTIGSILENMADYVYSLNKDWNFVYLNKRTAEDCGYPQDELIGKNFWKTFERFLGTDVEKNFHEVMTQRVIRRFEWKTIYAQGYCEFNVFPSEEGITVYGRDITDRKKLEELRSYTKNLERITRERLEQIRKNEQSYRELYESFGEAFIAVDWDLNVIHWNKAAERVTRTATKDALGKKLYNVLPEMNLVTVGPYLESLQQKKPTRFMMNVVSRETGKPSVFEISTYPSTLGIIVIVEDKTEEEETKRLSTIGQVAGMVGHDIRNPLQSIVASLFLVKSDIETLPDSQTKSAVLQEIAEIREQINYVNKIVADLQDFARPLKPELVNVDLQSLIIGSLYTLKVPENVEALAHFEEPTLKIKTDPMLLKRVLMNLSSNAIQAMPSGGKLDIKAFAKPDAIVITVQDTGTGIPEEIKDKMFTPLFTTKSKGQGFGLAVTKRIIEALNGSISFESQVGKGTKFTIIFPRNNKNSR